MLKALLLTFLANIAVAHSATFDDYECTDDCSGHQAGYDWAEEHDISDESSCSTASQSFSEGCESYVSGAAGSITADDDEDDGESL
ncbi:hypothetical protein IB256_09875 [Pseudomonas sp. PDM17]|uniref:hypothetical protein n=1 Tax=Pseudomonas sp. PDM17 TaxID=2769285 RepID=UPI00177A782C|nr:hypothetical protein [Pseudomonas sp. PDM17]MBD9501086.1 hypothetical protein [Pseudomonas sp. PDM17]